jgi:uncharacterized YigZ family protein
MRILTNEPEYFLEVKKSKFISYARTCTDLAAIKTMVKETWAKHPEATHVVHAAVVGKSGSLFSSSDDKEPKNTAGRPALEVVKGSGITNVCVLIVRYFGGTLLGTGGLVQAYGDSAKGVLSLASTEELVEKSDWKVITTYRQYEPVKRLLEAEGCTITDEQFATDVVMQGTVATQNCPGIEEAIKNLTGAQTIFSFTPVG